MALIDLGRGGAGGRGTDGTPTKKPRLVMVVADPGRESAAAMEWALSHAIVEGDDILLLHVNMPLHHPNSGGAAGSGGAGPSRSSSGGSASSPIAALLGGGAGADGVDFMEAMRAACKARYPRARVHGERVEPATEGREAKAQTILAESQRRRVELLVIGHRRCSSFLRLRSSSGKSSGGKGSSSGKSSSGSSRGHDSTAEFLIEHSKCLCVSVQKKGQNAGYLLNTKTHKNFWLLA
ncbi:unnamed protein product [Urochloa decumbens]|uniref:UspA domain-containing protein n=1 Tax=Urochloa decumbens TaxID=240449 RepID=A0ABC8XYN4_9POAL